MSYQFQAYDVLQIKADDEQRARLGREWLDFGTLRDATDAACAVQLVDSGRFERKPATFRIVRPLTGAGVVYVKA